MTIKKAIITLGSRLNPEERMEFLFIGSFEKAFEKQLAAIHFESKFEFLSYFVKWAHTHSIEYRGIVVEVQDCVIHGMENLEVIRKANAILACNQ